MYINLCIIKIELLGYARNNDWNMFWKMINNKYKNKITLFVKNY
jgi:hypothetical protein